jgi:hypothetical protein
MFSCKNEDKKAEDKTEGTPTNVEKKMSVQMDVIQKTPENYVVYYTEDNTINFVPENTIWSEVKPSPDVQTLNFYFPESVSPTHVRFDLGNKPEREDVVLDNFKIIYGDKTLQVKGAEFFNYFYKNDSITSEVNQQTGRITFLKKKGSTAIPFFYPSDKLVEEIAKLTAE